MSHPQLRRRAAAACEVPAVGLRRDQGRSPAVTPVRFTALLGALGAGLLLGDVLGRFASEPVVRRGMIAIAGTGSVAAVVAGLA